MMVLRRGIIANTPHLVSASGNPIHLLRAAFAPVTECKVNLIPVQSGSGDPSPSNIRPISGFDGVTLNVSHETTGGTQYAVSWQTTGTVYGGSVDMLNGTLIQEWAYLDYDGSSDENWQAESISGGKNFYIMTPSTWIRNTKSTSDIVCNLCNSFSSLVTGVVRITSSGNLNAYLGPLIGANTTAEFRTWLSNHVMQVACRLQTPIVYQITAQSVKTLGGENYIWTNANDISLKYWTH